MSTEEINEIRKALAKQKPSLLARVMEKASKRNISLEEGITEAFIWFINKDGG